MTAKVRKVFQRGSEALEGGRVNYEEVLNTETHPSFRFNNVHHLSLTHLQRFQTSISTSL